MQPIDYYCFDAIEGFFIALKRLFFALKAVLVSLTPFHCNYRPLRRPLMTLLRPEYISITL